MARTEGAGSAAGRRPARRTVGRARRLGRVRAPPSLRPSSRPAATSGRSSSISPASGGGCRPITDATSARPPPTTTRAALGAEGPVRPGTALDRLAAADPAPVVFIGLHGPFGEDGTVQALLEAAGLAYTGSGVAASALGMDKALFKRMCRGLGLPVMDWREVRAARWAADRAGVRREMTAFAAGASDPRLMVKPAGLGSSVGMTLVHDAAELAPALDLAFRYDDAGARRVVPGRRARPGGVGHRERPPPTRGLRPGRGRERARVLRLRGEVHARPVGDLDRAPR